MPSRKRYLEARIDKYIERKTRRRKLSQENGERYRKHILRMCETLADAGLECTPKQIGEQEIDYLLGKWTADRLDTDTQKWYLSMLSGYLEFYGNQVISEMELGWPAETRTNVDWLTPEEAVAMFEAAEGVERIVIHMELRLWLRRIEVRRLTAEDIKENILNVHGKGRCGGKWRTLAWAPETTKEVWEYEQLREDLIEEARALDPNVVIPDNWIIYRKGMRLGAYGNTAIDNIVQRVADRAGINRTIGNHTLRRTGARIAWLSGMSIDLIKEALGHKTIEMTYRYLGITVDELAKEQWKVTNFLQGVQAKMKGIPEKKADEPILVQVPSTIRIFS